MSAETVRPSLLRLSAALYGTMLDHLLAAAPAEGVGLLATLVEGPTERAVHFYPGRNLDGSTTRYTMDPAGIVAAFVDMEQRGWRFGAIVHSHPSSPATPSATDLREAFYPDVLMLIVGLGEAAPRARAWSVETGTPVSVPVVVEDERGPTDAGCASPAPA